MAPQKTVCPAPLPTGTSCLFLLCPFVQELDNTLRQAASYLGINLWALNSKCDSCGQAKDFCWKRRMQENWQPQSDYGGGCKNGCFTPKRKIWNGLFVF